MLKLDEKESLDPKMSDFEWFGEVFNFSMFSWFYHCLLISEGNSCPIFMFDHSFWSLWPALQEYGVILPLGASKAPENGKTCLKIADVGNFWTCFAIFKCFRGLLVVISAQILVEEVLCFEMSTQTSKSDKN